MFCSVSPPSSTSSLRVLAPASTVVPQTFSNVAVDPTSHASLLSAVQRFRGAVYLQDGAIGPMHLSDEGRHIQGADSVSWHLVAVEPDGSVSACARYRPHAADVRPEDLGVWESALARDPHWNSTLHDAITNEIERARTNGLDYVEVGGWAVARTRRGTMHAFETAVSAYALAARLGGCVGITTATVRHCSSRILRRLGGRSLNIDGVTVPPYFDPRYGCEMEILGFESRSLNRRYASHIERVFARFSDVPVIAFDGPAPAVSALAPVVSTVAALAEKHLPHFLTPHTLVPNAA